MITLANFALAFLLLFPLAERAELVSFGSNFPPLELENYQKADKKSVLRFKIMSNENKVVSFRLMISVARNEKFKFWKVYSLPIEKETFIKNNYPSDQNTLPSSISENQLRHFLTNCEYTIPLPDGEFILITGNAYSGLAKIFQGFNSFSNPFTVRFNQTYLAKLSENEDGKVIIDSIEEVSLSNDEKSVKCKY